MKKFTFVAFLFAVIFSLCLTTAASAKDLSRRFGIGIDSAATGFTLDEDTTFSSQGISVIYYINPYIGLQGILGTRVTTVSGDDNYAYTRAFWNVTLRALVPVALAPNANLGVYVGVNIAGNHGGNKLSSAKPKDETVESNMFFVTADVGLRPEVFINEHFSIHTIIGLSFNILLPKSMTGEFKDYNAKGVDISAFKGSSLLGNAGVTFYF